MAGKSEDGPLSGSATSSSSFRQQWGSATYKKPFYVRARNKLIRSHNNGRWLMIIFYNTSRVNNSWNYQRKLWSCRCGGAITIAQWKRWSVDHDPRPVITVTFLRYVRKLHKSRQFKMHCESTLHNTFGVRCDVHSRSRWNMLVNSLRYYPKRVGPIMTVPKKLTYTTCQCTELGYKNLLNQFTNDCKNDSV